MLLRNRAPERGASIAEYGAVILLVAALVAVLAFSGIPDRVAQLISGAIGAVPEAGEDPGDETVEGDDGGEADDCALWDPFCWFTGEDDPDPNEEEIREILEETEIGREALERLEEHGIDVEYIDGDGTCWYRSSGEIQVDTSRSPVGSAGCLVHEADHAERDSDDELADPGDYDEMDDYLRAMAEFEANARIIQVEFHKELREARGEEVERHPWETMYDDALENGGREAVLERFVEAYMNEESGAGSYRSTWEERWNDAHSCTEVFGFCIPGT